MKSKTDVGSDAFNIDMAFQELAELKLRTPQSRSEELSLQMKFNELNKFVTSNGNNLGRDIATSQDESPRSKPRPVRPS